MRKFSRPSERSWEFRLTQKAWKEYFSKFRCLPAWEVFGKRERRVLDRLVERGFLYFDEKNGMWFRIDPEFLAHRLKSNDCDW